MERWREVPAIPSPPTYIRFDRDIMDDHTPLNAVAIPTIDLIDFDFPAWHTPEDTVDKLSAESLHTVGAVVSYYLSEMALKQ